MRCDVLTASEAQVKQGGSAAAAHPSRIAWAGARPPPTTRRTCRARAGPLSGLRAPGRAWHPDLWPWRHGEKTFRAQSEVWSRPIPCNSRALRAEKRERTSLPSPRQPSGRAAQLQASVVVPRGVSSCATRPKRWTHPANIFPRATAQELTVGGRRARAPRGRSHSTHPLVRELAIARDGIERQHHPERHPL